MANAVLKMYEDIENIVANQLLAAMADLGLNPDDFYFTKEQAYANAFEDRQAIVSDKIYLILSYNMGTVLLNAGVVQPFNIDAYCQEKKEETAKALLTYFGKVYTFQPPMFGAGYDKSDALIQQAYTTAQEIEKMIEYGGARAAHVQLQGTITYGENIFGFSSVQVYDQNAYKELKVVSYQFSYSAAQNSANLGDKNDFVSNVAKFGTVTLALSALPDKTLKIFRDATFNIPFARARSINQVYYFRFTINGNPDNLETVDENGNAYADLSFRILSSDTSKQTGSIPSITISLMEA